MKTYLDCLPCFMNQTLRAGRIATNDETKIKKLLDEVGTMIKDIPMENTPPVTGEIIYRKISEITGNYDPYKKIKQRNIEKALSLYPSLKEKVKKSDDRLLTALRISIAGNVLDYGVNTNFNINKEIEEVFKKEFAISDYKKFKYFLNDSKEILYLGDNAGEAVFDKILIEELGKAVTFVVREVPVINDITMKEAEQIGIDKIAHVISSGTTAPGTILDLCNDDFIRKFNKADMIISKGQGNYEGLSGVDRSIFFLLKVKCPVIARNIGVKENTIVLTGMNI